MKKWWRRIIAKLKKALGLKVDAPWKKGGERIYFPARASGEVSIETRNVLPRSGANQDGGMEYVIIWMGGEGFERYMFMNMGGDRTLRTFCTDRRGERAKFNIADNDVPNPTTWTIKWGDGYISVHRDNIRLNKSKDIFTGKPTWAVFGGAPDHKRNFRGEWRNAKAPV